MTQRLARFGLCVLLCGVGVVAALGLILQFRALPGPSVAMALPLQSPSQRDGASLLGVIASTSVLSTLAAYALPAPRARLLTDAIVRFTLVAAWALAIQAISLQLTSQAAFGFDWGGAATTATPWLFAASALVATVVVGIASPDRRTENGPTNQLVGASATRAERETLQV